MLYFAYGAHVNVRNLTRIARAAKVIGRAWLPAHRLVFKTYAAVVADAGSRVPGVLYELTPACLRALDRYEEVPTLYRRGEVTVETDTGPRPALIYLREGGEIAPPNVDYFNILARGYADWKFDAQILRKARFATLQPGHSVRRS
jgi:gamma-glutamylcyclotransferase (GGCT)/AIG2-like uncharacterized protein YtfP